MKKIALVLSLFITIKLMKAQTLPGSYIQSTVLSNVPYAIDFDWTPDGRILVTQKGAKSFPAQDALIKIFNPNGSLIGTFYNLTDSVDASSERGLLGIAVDPAFESNHYVYAYYNYRNAAQNKLAIRVVRFTENANVGTNPTLILNIVYATAANTFAGSHMGGIIGFRPKEPTKLYIEIGELAYQQTNPILNYANKLTNPYGKILRINTDGTIPKDNPFYDDGDVTIGKDDRIWSYGHRNMFGLCFNPVTDSMYASENGLNAWDEFNIIHKGSNYGWAACEGDYINSSTTTLCADSTTVRPITTWGKPLPAVTGCIFYSGTEMPEFNNHILVADNASGIIHDLTMGNPPAYNSVTSKTTFAKIAASGLIAIHQGRTDGCIYALKGGYSTDGILYKICHKPVGILSQDESQNQLGQNYPNPTTGKTQVEYSLAQDAKVTINMFDVTGRKIKSILSTQAQAGKHLVELNDLDDLPNGSYFYRLEVKQGNKIIFEQSKRMTLLR